MRSNAALAGAKLIRLRSDAGPLPDDPSRRCSNDWNGFAFLYSIDSMYPSQRRRGIFFFRSFCDFGEIWVFFLTLPYNTVLKPKDIH